MFDLECSRKLNSIYEYQAAACIYTKLKRSRDVIARAKINNIVKQAVEKKIESQSDEILNLMIEYQIKLNGG